MWTRLMFLNFLESGFDTSPLWQPKYKVFKWFLTWFCYPSFHLLPFLSPVTNEHCAFFICALGSVCISYYHSDKWIPRQSFGLWCYHSSYSLGVYLGPSSRAELKHQPSSRHFLYAQPLLRWQDSISPVGGLEEARVKWMGHSLSVLQMNARFNPPPFQLLSSAASTTVSFCTVVSIFKHNPHAIPQGQFVYEVGVHYCQSRISKTTQINDCCDIEWD